MEKQNDKDKQTNGKNKIETNKNTMSATTTTTTPSAPKSLGKLPENMFHETGKGDEKEIVTKSSSDVIASIVKQFGVKALGDKSPEDAVKALLLLSLRAAQSGNEVEIPEGLEQLEKCVNKKGDSAADFIQGFAAHHIECKAKMEEKKNTEKEAKAKEREAEKEAKKEQDKLFAKEAEEFGDMFVTSISKFKKQASKISDAVTASLKLPDKVTITSGGMGVNLANGATKADIANAAAAAISTFEGLKNAEGALQFIIGDLTNAAVKAGTYRTQGDAASGIKFLIQDKCQKTFDTGTIQQYAMMAARIPSESRKMGVKPSLYLKAAKVTPPRIKGARPENMEEAEAAVQSFRDELIEEINSGSVNTTDLDKKVLEFKKEQGFVKESPVADNNTINNMCRKLVMALWMSNKLTNANDNVVVARGKDSFEYSSGDLIQIQEEVLEFFEGNVIAKDYDIDSLRKGSKSVEKNGKSKDVVYRMNDPFFVKTKDGEPLKLVEVKDEDADEDEVDEVIISDEDEDDDL